FASREVEEEVAEIHPANLMLEHIVQIVGEELRSFTLLHVKQVAVYLLMLRICTPYPGKESLITFGVFVRDSSVSNFVFVFSFHVDRISFGNSCHLCCEILSVNERATAVLFALEIAHITHHIGRVVLID